MSFSLPPASKFNSLTQQEQIETLNHLFEPCPTLTSTVIPKLATLEFKNYKDLIESTREILLSLLDSNQNLDVTNKIIAAHPRLGPSKEKLSIHSNSEQKSLNSSSSPVELAKLIKLNELYEIYFPGLRFVVFVNGRSRDVIMGIMLDRIKRNDIELERRESFDAMCDIALDRAKKLGAKL